MIGTIIQSWSEDMISHCWYIICWYALLNSQFLHKDMQFLSQTEHGKYLNCHDHHNFKPVTNLKIRPDQQRYVLFLLVVFKTVTNLGNQLLDMFEMLLPMYSR